MIFKISDINSEYTKILLNYLNKGYVIRSKDMNSVYSNEICHIDLVNPKLPNKTIRIWMSRSLTKFNDDLLGYISTIEIRVKEYDIDPKRSYVSLWLEDGYLINSITFYELKEGLYKNDLEDVLKNIKLRQHRMTNNYVCKSNMKIFNVENLPTSFVTSVLERIHQNYGCKRATIKCIKSVALNKDCNNKFYATIDWTHNKHSGIITIGG